MLRAILSSVDVLLSFVQNLAFLLLSCLFLFLYSVERGESPLMCVSRLQR